MTGQSKEFDSGLVCMEDRKLNSICPFVLESICLLNSNNRFLIIFLHFLIYCKLPQTEMSWIFLDL